MLYDILNDSSEWYVDGTFSVSPVLFKQVLTLNVIFRGRNLRLVYSLLPNKSEATYTRFFKMLLNNEIKTIAVPKRFIVDFELAIVNTLEKQFETIVSGCYFHFIQSMWRNVSQKGLIPLFNKDSLIRLAYRRIKSLPFLKVKHVVKAFKLIVKEAPESFKVFLDILKNYKEDNLLKTLDDIADVLRNNN